MNTTSGLPTETMPSGSRSRRWRGVVRNALRPLATRRTDLSTSASVNAQFWLGEMPWRPTAAWAALAGVLAAGSMSPAGRITWPVAVLLFLLVDPLWGAVWRLAAGRAEQLPLHDRVIGGQFWLPYLAPDSPAAHLFGRNTGDTLPVLFRIAFPTVVVTLLVASALGVPALVFTGLAIVVTLFGWINTRRAHTAPIFLHSVMTVGLPWLLASLLAGATLTDARGLTLMAALWVVHQWGAGRLARVADDVLGLALLAAADVLIGAVLIWLQTPLWLAVWFACALPTWFAVAQRTSVRRVALWHVGALLACAAAVGQAVI